ncbi:MAG: hypothetical protein JW969_07020 [Spirochaetales bacterium]|nr:hypothetical protein [Spirochaetales bacterium]
MGKYISIICAIAFLLVFAGYGEDISYIVKPGDTLEDIAVDVYKNLPESETPATANAFRAHLIYRENKGLLGLEMLPTGYTDIPRYTIEPGMELAIPVKDTYPPPTQLKALIDKDLFDAKMRIKKEMEAMEMQGVSQEKTGQIREMVFSRDFNDQVTLVRMIHANPAYVLTDKTAIPAGETREVDLYVWKIIQNEEAKKTIVIFPDTRTFSDAGYKKLLIMEQIAGENPEKNQSVLLESFDNEADRKILEQFQSLQNGKLQFDARKVLNARTKGIQDMLPSMAWYYRNPGTGCLGIENSAMVKAYRERAADLDRRIEKEYEAYRKEILKDFYRLYKAHTDLMILQLEGNIQESFNRNRFSNPDVIKAVNRLQRDFALLYLKPDFLDHVLAEYTDKRIDKILTLLDKLLGARTKTLFMEFRDKIHALETEYISPEVSARLKQYKRDLTRKLKHDLIIERDTAIAGAFSSLEDGTLGICELGLEHIQNQIDLCRDKKSYNLVIFHHPDLKDDSKDAGTGLVPGQDPARHLELMESFPAPSLVQGSLVSYDLTGTEETSIEQAYTRFSSGDYSYQYEQIENRRIFVNLRQVPENGALLRLCYKDNDSITAKFFFVPGKTPERQYTNIGKLLDECPLPLLETRVLSLFKEVCLADINL